LRLTCDEFYAWRGRGVFEHKPALLLDGELLVRSVASPMRATALCLASEALRTVFRNGFVVRTHMPLPLGENTDPMPDLVITRGTPRDHSNSPADALLVCEVSESTLDFDTDDKASLYAAAGIADYWVVDLVNRQVVVFRDPVPDAARRFGAGYATVTTHPAGQSVSPLAVPTATVAVADLLP
jgi:Uma2 family endonuclease